MEVDECMAVTVNYRGKALEIDAKEDWRREDLSEVLAGLTGVEAANQKLIHRGKTITGDGLLKDFSIVRGSKLLLLGSRPEELRVAEEAPTNVLVRNDFDPEVVPKGYKKVPLRSAAALNTPYKFERLETLPGLPEEQKAREILEQLANDPGVLKVLEKHKWTVGCLAEMYPEGKVGISDVCVMGLNQNHGAKILLRLRTDDLRGFRKILSIRKVLFHELAHNVHSDHDDNFYKLMRQVEREVNEMDWTQQGGKQLTAHHSAHRGAGEISSGGYVLVKQSFEGKSARLGGDSSELTQMFSAAELAAQAAVLRLSPEEEEIEHACGCSSSQSIIGHPPMQSIAAPPEPEPLAAAMPSPPLVPVDAVIEAAATAPEAPMAPEEVLSGTAAANTGPEVSPAAPSNAAVEMQSPLPDDSLGELLAMGFDERQARHALESTGGTLQEAVMLLLGGSVAVTAAAASADERGERPQESRESRLTAAVQALAANRDAEALDTLISIFQTIMDQPYEPKFRRINCRNSKFQRTLGSRVDGVAALRAAGFEEVQQAEGGVLELKRDDLGLLWMAKSLAETYREQLPATTNR
ncbi:unnamed protein product [Chrysoparadoxa australica]